VYNTGRYPEFTETLGTSHQSLYTWLDAGIPQLTPH
jgi:hypothetical protein